MSEKKEPKCCGCCKGVNKELNNEDLDKVTGGNGWQNGKYICIGRHCLKSKEVDGVANVCTCADLTTNKCCRMLGDSCTCKWWDKKIHMCSYDWG